MAKTSVAAKKTCFVISPIDKPGSAVRERSDTLLDYIIKPVLGADGLDFSVERADEIQKPGLITQQVIERVVTADLVVADLTDRNANVFYELALRHAARKPAIHMIKGDDTIPFDVANQRTIYYDVDIRHAEEAKRQLEEQTEAVLADPSKADNPISSAMQLLQFEKSTDPVEQGIARVLDEVSAIRAFIMPVISTVSPAETQKERVNRAIGEGLLRIAHPVGGTFAVPATEVVFGTPLIRWGPDTICANCGQPIGSPVTVLRSSDSQPIHPPGQCPALTITPSPSRTPST